MGISLLKKLRAITREAECGVVGRGGVRVGWSGTERFRPRREQPGSNGARGSVLKAVAAHRRGMLRPRAPRSGTRANIQLSLV